LCFLVERSDDLVTSADIVDRIWGKSVFINSESSINTAIRKIRRVLNDTSDPPKFVVTIPAKGYRFIATVQTLNDELNTNGESIQVGLTVFGFAAALNAENLLAITTGGYRTSGNS